MYVSQKECTKAVTQVVYGGEQGYAHAVRSGVKILHDEGIPSVFVRAADNNDDSLNAVIIAYAQGEKRNGLISANKFLPPDADYAERNAMEQSTYEMGKRVYNTHIKPNAQ